MSVAVTEIVKNTQDDLKNSATVTIGILGLQGDYAAHLASIGRVEGVESRLVKLPADLDDCDGLIIPGGESTTVGKLMERYGIDEAIRKRVSEGMAVFGTCTGMILMAKEIENSNQQRLGLMDITVRRNAFGRQVDSFETDFVVEEIGSEPIRAVFIRAPFAIDVRGTARILYQLDEHKVIFVRQDKLLAAAFHPELTDDIRVHSYFADIARGNA